MATESDVAQSAEQLRANFQGLSQTTSDLAAKESALASATSAAYNSLKGFSSSMASGRAEMQNLNQIYEVMGSAAGKTSRVIGELGSKIPFIGGFFSAAGKAGEAAAKTATTGFSFLNVQLQTTLKQFQAFGSIGALGAQGMTGLRDQIVQSGMTMEGFQQAVMANSQSLAAFAGTTSDGAKQLSEAVGAITRPGLGDALRNIGMNADQIGEAAAGFMAREQRLGRAQGMSQEQLTKGTVAYAKELDILARLTGQSVDTIRKQQDAIMSESRYRAAIFKLDDITQKRLSAGQQMFSQAPQVAKGIRDLVSGVGDTVESANLLTLTGGAAQDAVDRLKSGAIDEFQFRKELTEKIRENAGAFADIAQFGDGANSAVGNFAQIADVAATNVDGIQSATTAQKKLSTGLDGLTIDTVNAQKALESMTRVVMNLVTNLMPFAAKLAKITATGMVEAVNMIPGLGLPTLNSDGTRGQSAPGAPAAPAAPAPALTRQQRLDSMTSSQRQSVYPSRLDRLLNGNSAPVATNPAPTTAPPGNPQDLLQFEGTSLQNFQNLDSNMQTAILSAAQDFYRDTGQKLRISSAYRSREQQEALWNNRGNNRYPVAPPGTSSHERGQAVDILNFQTAERYLKQQGLYRPDPVGDPIHFGYGAGDANGVSGPGSGYRPTLNSNASVSNTNNNTAPAQNNADNSILTEQLNKLDRIMQATERQAQLAQQMLSYAS